MQPISREATHPKLTKPPKRGIQLGAVRFLRGVRCFDRKGRSVPSYRMIVFGWIVGSEVDTREIREM